MRNYERRRTGARWPHLRLGRRGALEAEVREEIDEHVALCVEYLMARGHSRAEAERAARERFGDFDGAMRRLYASAQEREHRLKRWKRWEDLRQDARLAMRLFRRAPAFFVAAMLTLALGIGANGAVFSVVRATLLEPLPYEKPHELVMIWKWFENIPSSTPGQPKAFVRGYMTAQTLRAWRDSAPPGLSAVAGIYSSSGNSDAAYDLTLADRAVRLRAALVTPNFFDLLGVKPLHGRLFGAGDETSGEPLIVLSHAMWQQYFGGDTGVVGQTLTVTGGRPREPRSFTVLGVLPAAFRFTYPEPMEAWAMMPWSFVETYSPTSIAFHAVGRLAPGYTFAQAAERLRAVRTGVERPGEPPGQRQILIAEPMRDWIVGETRPSLVLLTGVALL